MPNLVLYIVAEARPNFMKIAPIIRALWRGDSGLTWKLIHTGQHYDHEMNDVFFEELDIPAPDISLGGGSGSHVEQTAMVLFELVDTDRKRVVREARQVLAGQAKSDRRPELWGGKAVEYIVSILAWKLITP